MVEKNTSDLEFVLKSTHISDFESFCEDNKESMNSFSNTFFVYIKELIQSKGLTQQTVFLKADIPERYGYKLLSGEKRTKKRDIILRICYAAELSLEETQHALKKYEMPELYVKNPRDALLMIIFNERPGDIIDVNELLIKQGMDALKTSGVQD